MSLMPWQRHVVDVALELRGERDGYTDDPSAPPRFLYKEVRLTVPRQSGKSSLMVALMVWRCISFGGKQRIGMTAQTGQAARTKFRDDFVPMVQASIFSSMARPRYANGEESLRWDNGSIWSVLPTTETAAHGGQYDLAVIDEAFALPDDRLEQAFKPAMVTRTNPQLWIVSTAGDVDSHYLNQKIDDGRIRVESGHDSGVAYFEWSAPDDVDPGDAGTWRACMPALGHTIAEESIRADFESMRLSEFRRAYLNQRQNRKAVEPWQVIAEDVWGKLADVRSKIVDDPVLALDVTPDRSMAAICAAGHRKDGKIHVEVVEHRAGTEWIVDWLAERAGRYGPLVVDPGGPAGPFVAPLAERGVETRTVAARWVAHACSQFYDTATTGRLRHLDQTSLNVAMSGASRRSYGDLWLWARKDLATDVCPLVAATLALGGVYDRAKVEEVVPVRVISLADLD